MAADLGHYRLLRLLGRGGFGEVYEAEDTVMHRRVALKVIADPYAGDPEFRERLFREARTAGSLHDPHVIAVHGCGELDGRLYIDMRLVDGIDLGRLIQQSGPLPAERAVSLIEQIASALDAAHEAGMVHRDVKPGNVIVTEDDFACLVDFGLANAAGDSALTGTGKAVGTVAYMAPERFGSAPTGPPADVYALACVLYECLTGAPPFVGDFAAVFGAHMSAAVPQLRPGVPTALDAVIARGMAKQPGDRYPTAGALADAARAAVSPVQATEVIVEPPPPVYSATPAYVAPPITYPSIDTEPPDLPVVPPPSQAKHRGVILGVIGVVAVVVAAIVFFALAPGFDPIRGERVVADASISDQIAVSGDGTLYVSTLDSGEFRIRAIAPDTTTRELALPGCSLGGMTVDRGGTLLAACTESAGWFIYSFPPGAGAPTKSPCPDLGEGVAELGFTVDPKGAMYAIIDGKRIVRFALGSTDVTGLPFAQLRTVDADFNTRATSVAIGSDGAVWVTTLSGPLLKLEPGAQKAVEVASIRTSTNLAINERDVYVISGGASGDGLHHVDPATDNQRRIELVEKPWAVAVDDAGNVYTNAGEHGIIKYTPEALGVSE